MYSVEINYKAEAEIDKIGWWYDKRVPGLSFRFYNDLDNCIQKIIAHPSAFGFYDVKKNVRKSSLKIFPYIIYYYVKVNTIYFLAIIHSKRSPDFISRRLH